VHREAPDFIRGRSGGDGGTLRYFTRSLRSLFDTLRFQRSSLISESLLPPRETKVSRPLLCSIPAINFNQNKIVRHAWRTILFWWRWRGLNPRVEEVKIANLQV